MAPPTTVVVGAVALLAMRIESLMQVPTQLMREDSERSVRETSADYSLSDWAWQAAQNPNHLLLRSEKRKLLFCMIPKNACTEFLSLVMRLDGLSAEHWNPGQSGQPQVMVHFDEDRTRLFLQPSQRQVFEDVLARGNENGWTRAVFLRDPAERLLSTYKSKVQTGYYQADYPSTLTLTEFVTRLESNGLDTSTEPHLRPQSFLCGLNETIDHFNFVGNFESLEAGANQMVGMVGGKGLAEELLNDGWGPLGNQSLFGVSRELREGGTDMMPVTHSADASWLRISKLVADKIRNSAGDSTSLESGIFWQNSGAERMDVMELMDQLNNDPELKRRVEKLYAMDYALIQRARPKQRA